MNKNELIEALNNKLLERFGDNWRKKLKLEIWAAEFYWLVVLALHGLEAKKKDLLAQLPANREASVVASICSWEADLETLIKEF